MPQKAIKNQAVTDFLADIQFQELQNFMTISWTRLQKLTWSTLPQKNKCCNYSLAERQGQVPSEISSQVLLISPHNYVISHAFSLTESCSNNISEYNAFLIEMQLVEDIGVKNLEAYGDPKLIVNQVIWHEDLVPYHNATIDMTEKFKNFHIDHVLR